MNPLAFIPRAFASNLGTLPLPDADRAALDAKGIRDPIMQRYVLWRRATVLMVVVGTLLSAGVSTFRTFTDEDDEPELIETVTDGLLNQLKGAVPAALPAQAQEAAARAKETAAEAREAATTAKEESPEAKDEAPAAKPSAPGSNNDSPTKIVGRVVDAIHLFSLYVLPIAALSVLFLGDRSRLSFRILIGAFLFSFFAPMLLAICPWSWWGYTEPH